jgi:hypothetical protein
MGKFLRISCLTIRGGGNILLLGLAAGINGKNKGSDKSVNGTFPNELELNEDVEMERASNSSI